MLLALPVLVLGAFQPATLTNGVNRVAVFSQEQAQKLFGEGYVLEGAGKAVQKVCDCTEFLGSAAGNTFEQRMFANQGATQGGALATSSTASTYTLTAKDLKKTPSVVLWTPNVSTTISITATSTYDYVPKIGDVATVYMRNASSTAASTITLAAANTQVDLQKGNYTGADLVIDGLDWEKLTFIRKSALTVTVFAESMTEGD